jgi:hypothetical protein
MAVTESRLRALEKRSPPNPAMFVVAGSAKDAETAVGEARKNGDPAPFCVVTHGETEGIIEVCAVSEMMKYIADNGCSILDQPKDKPTSKWAFWRGWEWWDGSPADNATSRKSNG